MTAPQCNRLSQVTALKLAMMKKNKNQAKKQQKTIHEDYGVMSKQHFRDLDKECRCCVWYIQWYLDCETVYCSVLYIDRKELRISFGLGRQFR